MTRGLENLPPHMRQGVIDYLENGIPPGGFLQAVLENKLVESFGRADDDNRRVMWEWANWLYNYCPIPAWGSSEKVAQWIEQGGHNGRND